MIVRFVLDVHLGKLARHLRMLGYDALWRDDYEDDQLLAIARDEARMLLTRDRELCGRAEGLARQLIGSSAPATQLLETLEAAGQKQEALRRAREDRQFLSRCLECNTLLLPAKPHQVHHLLPGSLLLEHDEFRLCQRCERVFWKGSHFDRMREWIEKLLTESKNKPAPH